MRADGVGAGMADLVSSCRLLSALQSIPGPQMPGIVGLAHVETLPAPKVRAFVEFMCDRYPEMSLVLKG
jgi:hypothetical protein